jgi:hypothetical protein
VAQRYTQIEGIDFDEIFTSVTHLESVSILIVIDCHLNFKLYQTDVKNAFLNGILQEEVYIGQPKGFTNHLFPNHIYRLKKPFIV